MVRLDNPACAAPLFDGWDETMIWSVLQGKMGTAYADDAAVPRAARLDIADFCFLAGEPQETLLADLPGAVFCILVPRTAAWAALIRRICGAAAKSITRYAFAKPTRFDAAVLRGQMSRMPDGFSLHPIDDALYCALRQSDWGQDLVRQFADEQDYAARGVGMAVLHAGEPVCGASSYTVYNGGIEIEMDTAPAFRRRGLARACAAALILECLRREWYPAWDAANPESAHLAQTLGYGEPCAYTAYEIIKKPQP